MKYSVLVVDDEPLTRKYLLKAIPGLCSSFNQIYEAAHGKAGLEVLSEKSCDLIITDICMPEMDGLQFAEEAKKINPDQQIVILSGYEEFAYAQKAIRCGVSAYLLKPIERDKLRDVLSLTKDILDKQRKTERGAITLRGMEDKYNVSVASEYLSALAERDYAKIKILLPQLKQMQEPIFQEENAVLSFSVGSVTLGKHSGSVSEYSSVDYILLKALQDLFGEWRTGMVRYFHSSGSRLVLLSAPRLEEQINGLFMFFSSILQKGMEIDVVCGASELFSKENDLLRAIEQAEIARKLRWVQAPSGLLKYGEINEKLDDLYQLEFAKNSVLQSIGDQDWEIKASSISEFISSAGKYTETSMLSHCVSLFLPLKKSTFTTSIKEDMIDAALKEFHQAERNGCLTEKLPSVFMKLTDNESEVQIHSNPQLERVAEIKKYIQDNYGRQISLTDIASHMELTPNYISNIFGKYEKEGYIKYLTRVRMENAARLLLHFPSMKVADIAQQCGFLNVKHFYHVFRQTYNCSPKAFRSSKR